jgi:hypothetical protein
VLALLDRPHRPEAEPDGDFPRYAVELAQDSERSVVRLLRFDPTGPGEFFVTVEDPRSFMPDADTSRLRDVTRMFADRARDLEFQALLDDWRADQAEPQLIADRAQEIADVARETARSGSRLAMALASGSADLGINPNHGILATAPPDWVGWVEDTRRSGALRLPRTSTRTENGRARSARLPTDLQTDAQSARRRDLISSQCRHRSGRLTGTRSILIQPRTASPDLVGTRLALESAEIRVRLHPGSARLSLAARRRRGVHVAHGRYRPRA